MDKVLFFAFQEMRNWLYKIVFKTDSVYNTKK
jgi:hypothetical protein